MRVEVDFDLCEGHGKCRENAPTVFDIREDDRSYVVVDEVPAELVPNVERAIKLCPRAAVR